MTAGAAERRALRVSTLDGPVDAVVHLPGSKSLANRALLCAALATGTSTLRGVLRADDTEAMLGGIAALGARVTVLEDGAGPGNDDFRIEGCGGAPQVPAGGALRLDARQSGTTSRFLLAAASLVDGPVHLDGSEQLRARPMGDGVAALRRLGRVVDGDTLPLTVSPGAAHNGTVGPAADGQPPVVEIAGSISSQFLSGLLLAAPCHARGMEIRVIGALQSVPYVEMTLAVMRVFGARVTVVGEHDGYRVEPTGYTATDHVIEPDASAASYFWAIPALCGGTVTIPGLGTESIQGDMGFLDVLAAMGAEVTAEPRRSVVRGAGRLRGVNVDMAQMSDTAQTLAALAPFADGPTEVSGIGFIRAKETDRVAAVVAELQRCGIEATELADGFRILPGIPRPTVFHTYADHRMAMSFALIGLRVPGIEIDDAECVSKTFPGFWRTLDGVRRSSVAARGAP